MTAKNEPQLPEYFSRGEHYACYRPLAETTLRGAVEMVDDAIRYCRLNDISRLLIDFRQVTGFPSPSTTERYLFTKKWAETAGGKLVVSMVAQPAMIDPDKIGVTMAENRGLLSNVFAEEASAIEWLLTCS